jgi:hypothetical protein
LKQAINHLKGEPVIASSRTQSAAATTPATVTAPAPAKDKPVAAK